MEASASSIRSLHEMMQRSREVLLPDNGQFSEGGLSSAKNGAKDTLAEADAAFTALVGRNADFLFRIASSLLRNSHDAEDAVQECLLKLHRSGGWRTMVDERAFLARSCWRAALDRLPRKGTHFIEANDETMPRSEGEASPETAAIASAQREQLHRLIDALPLKLREPLLLSGFDDLNSREIAAILRIPEGTARTRLKRAREELRRRWEQAARASRRSPGRE